MDRFFRSALLATLVMAVGWITHSGSSLYAQITYTVGTGNEVPANTLFSPVYRFSSTSTVTNARSNIVFTQSELAAAGISSGTTMTALSFDKASSGATIPGSPLAMTVLMANSTTTPPLSTGTTWASILASHTLVYSEANQEIPASTGWVTFTLNTPFLYTGGSLEIAIETSFGGTSPFTTDKLDWIYTNGTENSIVAGTSSGTTFSATLNSSIAAYKHRPNTRFTLVAPPGTDAALTSLPSLENNSFCPGSNAVTANLVNFAANTLTNATINWTVNGVLQTPYTWTGSLSAGDSEVVSIGNLIAVAGTTYDVVAYLSAVTPGTDLDASNDTTSISGLQTGLSGAVTINAANPSAGTNFASFTDLANALNSFGICGPVTVAVAPNSGPYNEQVIFGEISGASATNSLTIQGNGNTLTYLSTNTNERATLKFNGTDYVTVDNLIIEAQGAATGEFGFAVQISNGADFNTFTACEFIANESSTSANFAAFVASNSATSATAIGLAASNLTVTGCRASGGYYGIAVNGETTPSASQNNVITNNQVEDFYFYGIYLRGQNGGLIAGNDLYRVDRPAITTTYMIYFIGDMSGSVINGNRMRNFAGSISSSTSAVYGIYGASSTSATVGQELLVSNNLIYGYEGMSGTTYGIYYTTVDGVNTYHNTVSLDNTTATGTSVVRAFFHSSTTATRVDIKNNIFSVTNGNAGTKYCLYFSSAAAVISSDNNVLYMGSTQGTNHTGYADGTSYTTLADWQGALLNIYDQQSVAADPVFTNPTSGDFAPSLPSLNDIYAALPSVPADFFGTPRGPLTDPGAVEFDVASGVDAALIGLPSLSVALCPGPFDVTATLANFGGSNMTSTTIGWTVNGVLQTPYVWTGTLAPGQDIVVTIGNFVAVAGQTYDVVAFVTAVAPGTDPNAVNDSSSVLGISPGLSGAITINAANPTGGTNFASFNDLATVLNASGICGPVTATVAPNSGPYNEQVILGEIAGTSSTNTLTILGNGNTLTYLSTTTAERATLKLNGTDYVTVDSLTIVAEGAATGEFGFAVQLTNGADFNTFTASEFVVNESSTSTNFAAFVASSSATSATTAGLAASNLTITGCKSSGGYYGIVVNGPTSAPFALNNVVTNNLVEDFHGYGLYLRGQQDGEFSNNEIYRVDRPAITTTYMIGFFSDMSGSVINGNRMRNFAGSISSSTSTAYGIYGSSSTSATIGQELLVSNNLIYGFEGMSSTTYGIYYTTVDGVNTYHNTVSLDNTTATGTSVVRAFFHSSTTATRVDIKNNIFSVTNGNAGIKYCLYFSSSAAVITSDNNVLLMGSTSGTNHIGYDGTTSHTTLADWQNALSNIYDQESVSIDPLFTSPTTGDFTPNAPLINDIYLALPEVPTDFFGVARGASTDPGAIEFTVASGVDATLIDLPSLNLGSCAGSVDVTATLGNFGGSNMTSTTIDWTVNGVAQTPYVWTGSLPSGQTTVITIGSFAAVSAQTYDVIAFVTAVAPGTDPNPVNDTTSKLGFMTGLAGAYTINAANPSAGANFANFTDLANALNSFGICGPTTVTVAPGSGPYNEQVILGEISGASATNTLSIEGNGNTLTYLSTNTNERATLKFNGTDYVTVDSLTIVAQGAATGEFGFAVQLSNSADFNTFTACEFIANESSTSANFAAFVASNSATSATTIGLAASNLTVTGCRASGGYYGITVNGETTPSASQNNVITNNRVEDFYFYGIYLRGQNGGTISGNDIYRVDRATITTTYMIYFIGDMSGSEITGNRMRDFAGSISSSTSAVYGIYGSSSTSATVGQELLVSNNLIYGYEGMSGTTYGIYYTTVDGVNTYHNTVSLDNTTATGTSVVRALFHSGTTATRVDIKNNIFSVTNGNAGIKYCLYFSSAAAVITSDNNVLYMGSTQGTNHTGFANGTSYTTLADWQGALLNIYDQQSASANPLFVNPPAGDLAPTNPLVSSIATPLALVPTDFFGLPRGATPDPGAIEFVPQTCLKPSTGIVVSTSTDTAVVDWTENGSATNWEIEYGLSGFVQGTGTKVLTTTKPATLTGLMSSSFYEFYVRSICAPGDTSFWSNPVGFQTACDIFGLPLVEDFDGPGWISGAGFGNTNDAISQCWSRDPISPSYFWGTRTGPGGSTSSTGPLGAFNGNNYLITEASNGSQNDPAWIATPTLDLSTAGSPQLSFYYHLFGPTMGNLFVQVNNGTGWTSLDSLIGQQQTNINDPWLQRTVDLTAYSGDTIQIRWLSLRGSSFTSDMAIDAVVVEDLDPCGILPGLPLSVAQAMPPACNGDLSGSIEVVPNAGVGPFTYAWNTGSTDSVLTNLAAGTYTVTVTDSAGCVGDISTTLAEPAALTLSISVDATTCEGDSAAGITASIGGGTGTLTYLWSNGVDDELSLTGLPAATYTILVTDSLNCTITDSIVIVGLPVPVIDLGADPSICDGDSVVLDAGAGFSSYDWSDGSTTQTTVAKVAGTYGVVVTGGNGCASLESTVTLTVNPKPVVDLGPDLEVCEGTPLRLDAGAGFSTYAWNDGSADQTLDVTATGTYDVVVTDANGCVSTPDSVSVTIFDLPVVDLGADTTIVIGTTLVLDAGDDGATYLWSTGATTQTIDVTAAGTYSVVVTTAEGCEDSDEIVIETVISIADQFVSGLSLYPNPSQGISHLDITLRQPGSLSLRLYDTRGRLLMQKTEAQANGKLVLPIDLQAYPEGVYLLDVSLDGRTLTNVRIVKQ